VAKVDEDCAVTFEVLQPLTSADAVKRRLVIPPWMIEAAPSSLERPPAKIDEDEILRAMVDNSIELFSEA
jgi:hypothetical protein